MYKFAEKEKAENKKSPIYARTRQTISVQRQIGPAPSNAMQKMPSTAKGEAVVQKKANRTGMPDSLKNRIENLSGYSMDDVRVHYNSEKPAQIHALAYTQGTDIHISPGQEKHLPHEAWHVVQQKQKRVAPTLEFMGARINDNQSLEHEADIMGSIALRKES